MITSTKDSDIIIEHKIKEFNKIQPIKVVRITNTDFVFKYNDLCVRKNIPNLFYRVISPVTTTNFGGTKCYLVSIGDDPLLNTNFTDLWGMEDFETTHKRSLAFLKKL